MSASKVGGLELRMRKNRQYGKWGNVGDKKERNRRYYSPIPFLLKLERPYFRY